MTQKYTITTIYMWSSQKKQKPQTNISEKFAHENGRKYYIRVATSDGLEQIIIRGQGCHLVSAREFEQEVLSLEEQLRVNYNL